MEKQKHVDRGWALFWCDEDLFQVETNDDWNRDNGDKWTDTAVVDYITSELAKRGNALTLELFKSFCERAEARQANSHLHGLVQAATNDIYLPAVPPTPVPSRFERHKRVLELMGYTVEAEPEYEKLYDSLPKINPHYFSDVANNNFEFGVLATVSRGAWSYSQEVFGKGKRGSVGYDGFCCSPSGPSLDGGDDNRIWPGRCASLLDLRRLLELEKAEAEQED